ncbi:hypothetical protein [Rhizobium sp. C1]|uniref:hypothetical protein n=1 Tax=Rhizobium sp. C1 TaxID=1349799 RepID=UPI001E4ACBE0|nr:hypothetical protein [Rhizobium sp. C1]MCD2177454.1 hypothetical protein [Rhizobium sp. C1]
MAEKVSFSGENLSLQDTADFHGDTQAALKQYYSVVSPTFQVRFFGQRPEAVEAELELRLAELNRNSTLTVLALLEARFRIDYEIRRRRKMKDVVSVEFRALYARKGSRVSLESDILSVWRTNQTGQAALIGRLQDAFKFRHWMAHGRYWTPKFGKRIDYLAAVALAQSILTSFPLLSAE